MKWIAPKLLILLLLPLFLGMNSSGWAMTRPETHVWGNFSATSKCSSDLFQQGLDVHQDNSGIRLENASDSPVYLYCKVNPVNGKDPSGHDDMAELSMSSEINAGLEAEEDLGVMAAKRALTAKLVDIYACLRISLVLPIKGKFPIHGWVYANQPGNRGVRYDIDYNELGPDIFTGTPGTLSAKPATLAEVEKESTFPGVCHKIASLNEIQYATWNAFVGLSVGAEGLVNNTLSREISYGLWSEVPLNFRQFPEVINCLTFTIVASLEAKMISLK